ncbi:MAG: alpha/beta hydrolase [Thermoleophilia bacterium]|nr:alpha/beta hydrolase [Thermoleophilia bacterium]
MDVAVDDSGGDGPPILMLHGLTATRRYVVHGSALLARGGYRTVMYDARGHGDSAPAPRGDYGYDRLAGDAVGVMDTLGIERAVLMGVSMGSATALRVALEHPERVAALVIITPAHRGAPSGNLDRWDALADGMERSGAEGFLEAFGPPPVPDRMRDAVTTMMRQRMGRHRHPAAVADALRGTPRSAAFDGIAALAAVGVPTLVVGSRDAADPEHPLSVSEEYARVIPGARLVVEGEDEGPLAWRGGTLSRTVAGFLEDAGLAPPDTEQ